MATLKDYFRSEADDFLSALEAALRNTRPDPAEVHRAARGLRGSAQIAREDRFFRAASAFENVTRSLAAGVIMWTDEFAERALSTIADLRALVDQQAGLDELDARAAAVSERWHGNAPRDAPASAPDAAEFRVFAGREAAALAEVIDHGIRGLQSDPRDREPLRAILRRQRALLGAARLDDIPVVAEILRAIEDLTGVIVKLDVAVKQEWLDVYRIARDALQASIGALLRGDDPAPSHALSRLRHMRAELLERYGEGEAVSAAHDTGLVQAQPAHSDQALDPVEEAAADEILELSDEASPEDVLELTDEASAEAVLELVDEAPDEDVLELVDEASDEDVLELVDEASAEADVLELGVEAPSEELLDLVEEAPADDMLELVDEAPAGAAGGARLRRALELCAILERAVADDPQARTAVEELIDILRDTAE